MGENCKSVVMKKIAIVHPEMGYVGTESVMIWVVESLKDHYDIDIIHCNKSDVLLSAVDDFYGSTLDKSKVKLIQLGVPRVFKKTSRGRLLKQHLLMRYCKKNIKNYDLFISTYNEMDFGTKGIQYIHFPEITTDAKFVLNSWLYKDSILRRIYQGLAKAISGYSKRNVRSNLTLANSQWTKEIVDNLYNVDSTVLYPPVLGDIEKREWENKENGLVFIGRISPDKRPLETIRILKAARERGCNLHIHILGNEGQDESYVDEVKGEMVKNSSWVFYEGRVSREKLRNIVASHKYGINGKKFEHFGIAVAEMIRGGNIVFVNDDGGQVEIVSKNDTLVYHSDDDAVKKICRVAGNVQLQEELRKELVLNSEKYSKENFILRIRRIVSDFLGVMVLRRENGDEE